MSKCWHQGGYGRGWRTLTAAKTHTQLVLVPSWTELILFRVPFFWGQWFWLNLTNFDKIIQLGNTVERPNCDVHPPFIYWSHNPYCEDIWSWSIVTGTDIVMVITPPSDIITAQRNKPKIGLFLCAHTKKFAEVHSKMPVYWEPGTEPSTELAMLHSDLRLQPLPLSENSFPLVKTLCHGNPNQIGGKTDTFLRKIVLKENRAVLLLVVSEWTGVSRLSGSCSKSWRIRQSK